jgi:hypothetical protein
VGYWDLLSSGDRLEHFGLTNASKKDVKSLACVTSFLILAKPFTPVKRALCFKGVFVRLIRIIPIILFLSACGNTGVIKMEKDKYMVSVKSAKVGFVNAAEEKVEAYKEANAFCQKQNKEVETINLDMRDSGLAQSASATLEFKCVEVNKT